MSKESFARSTRPIESKSGFRTDSRNKRSPLIGISTDISLKRTAVNTAYVQSVILSGGIPYMIPVTDNVEILRQIVSQLDGIVFTGGEDHPTDILW